MKDTDGDHFEDGAEVAAGSIPSDPEDTPERLESSDEDSGTISDE
jgi:hypothetical protein